jgi:hypothetical protein
MLAWILYVLFLVVLAAIACLVILLRPDQYFTRKRRIVCPETRTPVDLQVDTAHALKTFFTDVEDFRVKDCARWPARADCDQECLLQVDTKPAILDRTLARFYEGKSCARCGAALGDQDWKRGHFAMLDEKDEFVPAGQMPLKQFPMALEGCRPVCWKCHQAEIARQAMPELMFTGDRRGRHDEPWIAE